MLLRGFVDQVEGGKTIKKRMLDPQVMLVQSQDSNLGSSVHKGLLARTFVADVTTQINKLTVAGRKSEDETNNRLFRWSVPAANCVLAGSCKE